MTRIMGGVIVAVVVFLMLYMALSADAGTYCADMDDAVLQAATNQDNAATKAQDPLTPEEYWQNVASAWEAARAAEQRAGEKAALEPVRVACDVKGGKQYIEKLDKGAVIGICQ